MKNKIMLAVILSVMIVPLAMAQTIPRAPITLVLKTTPAYIGQDVTFSNERTGFTVSLKTNENGEAIYDFASTNIKVGDVIDVSFLGKINKATYIGERAYDFDIGGVKGNIIQVDVDPKLIPEQPKEEPPVVNPPVETPPKQEPPKTTNNSNDAIVATGAGLAVLATAVVAYVVAKRRGRPKGSKNKVKVVVKK